jgi:NAD(P)H-quinone oxidoreductase subunit 5
MSEILAIIVVGAPLGLFCGLGLMMLFSWAINESFTAHLTRIVILIGLGALLAIAVPQAFMQQWSGQTYLLGEIIDLPESHFHLRLEFMFDSLSVPMAILTYLLCGTIAAFATHYMHREVGFQRFFLLFAMFLAGMVLAVLAGSIETLFLGWELVGLSSALLVAFFHQRVGPVANGLRVWIVYRCSDAALLLAAVLLHHAAGEGEFSQLSGRAGWPHSAALLSPSIAFWAGLLFVIAACGKSALWPLSGWLPRAMEGPTPSSAVFYGALSIHLGAFLLLRISPLLDQSWPLSLLVVGVGVATAIYAAVVGRVQTDVKSGLAFASLLQVGLIVTEIGLGFRYLALVHMLGHASLRTLQLLRAPSILRDYVDLENALGKQVNNRLSSPGLRLRSTFGVRLYRLGLERGYLDVAWEIGVARPFAKFFLGCGRLETRWLQWLGNDPPPSPPTGSATQLMEETK